MPPLTRSQIVLNYESRINALTSELHKAQALNVKLLQEHDECADDYANILKQSAVLKSQLAQQEICLQDAICERDEFKFILQKSSEEFEKYTESLSIIKIHETNAALSEELTTIQSEHEQNIYCYEKELTVLRNEIISLQTENIELRGRLLSTSSSSSVRESESPASIVLHDDCTGIVPDAQIFSPLVPPPLPEITHDTQNVHDQPGPTYGSALPSTSHHHNNTTCHLFLQELHETPTVEIKCIKNTVMYSDGIGMDMGRLLSQNLSNNVLNNYYPNISISKLMQKISEDNSLNCNTSLIILVGNSLNINKNDLRDFFELLTGIAKRVEKVIFCALPYSSGVSDNLLNSKICKLNNLIYKMTFHSDIFFFDTNKFVQNFILNKYNLYLPKFYKRELACLLAYNVSDVNNKIINPVADLTSTTTSCRALSSSTRSNNVNNLNLA